MRRPPVKCLPGLVAVQDPAFLAHQGVRWDLGDDEAVLGSGGVSEEGEKGGGGG